MKNHRVQKNKTEDLSSYISQLSFILESSKMLADYQQERMSLFEAMKSTLDIIPCSPTNEINDVDDNIFRDELSSKSLCTILDETLQMLDDIIYDLQQDIRERTPTTSRTVPNETSSTLPSHNVENSLDAESTETQNMA